MPVPGAGGGVLEDAQPLRDGANEFERMELRLIPEPDGARSRNRNRQAAQRVRRDAEPVECGLFLFQLVRAVGLADIGVARLIVAVQRRAERAVLRERRLVGVVVLPCALRPQAMQKLVIDQAVLRCELGRRPRGDAAADAPRLDQRIAHASLLQPVGAQHAAQAAADDEHVRLQVTAERRKGRRGYAVRPQRSHGNSPRASMRIGRAGHARISCGRIGCRKNAILQESAPPAANHSFRISAEFTDLRE